jgi:hypothetical protein
LKSFKEFISGNDTKDYEWCTIRAGNDLITILYSTQSSRMLNEAKTKGLPVGGPYSIQFHSAHSPVGMSHLHAYERNNQLFALNLDGTAHDKSHGTRIPNRVASAISHYFPDFQLPQDNIIESAPIAIEVIAKSLLLCD